MAIGAPIPFESIAGIRNRQALANDLRARVYALAKLAPALDKPRPAVRKPLKPRPFPPRKDRAA